MLDLGVQYPIIQAPMAGITTPELAAAVSNAGRLGALGLGALNAEQARAQITRTAELTDRPFGVNLFCHRAAGRDAAREAAWLDRLAPHFARYGAAVPDALSPDYISLRDDDAMLRVIVETRPRVISFHFGLPRADQLEALCATGAVLLASAVNLEDAQEIARAGLDGIVAQGWQAGGHRGMFDENGPDARLEVLDLLAELRPVGLPLIAAGGIMTAGDVRAALDAGAVAAQCGTAFLVADEAATTAPHRAGLAAGETMMTRAISGRPARGLANHIAQIDPEGAPDYPLPYSATKALNRAALDADETGYGPFWAGTGCAQAQPGPAAEILARLVP
ncbi:MAG: nitronate monooxygenase [Paracoccus sp. (in: a-proteobacteria)]|nr:nitronate monooxygenase [Paracoccus sp. (in: a-proteobacteria)]